MLCVAALRELTHPGVVQLLDVVFSDAWQLYMVFECLESDLKHYIELLSTKKEVINPMLLKVRPLTSANSGLSSSDEAPTCGWSLGSSPASASSDSFALFEFVCACVRMNVVAECSPTCTKC